MGMTTLAELTNGSVPKGSDHRATASDGESKIRRNEVFIPHICRTAHSRPNIVEVIKVGCKSSEFHRQPVIVVADKGHAMLLKVAAPLHSTADLCEFIRRKGTKRCSLNEEVRYLTMIPGAPFIGHPVGQDLSIQFLAQFIRSQITPMCSCRLTNEVDACRTYTQEIGCIV